jgi:putative peptide zinc metalloprotease protein
LEPETRPRLRADVELLRGMDDHPLAYDPRTGVYHRLSEPAYALVRSLDGERSLRDLAGAVAARRPGTAAGSVLGNLQTFLTVLERSGLLEAGSPAPVRTAPAVPVPTVPRRAWLMRRFVVTRRLPRLLEPVAGLLRPGRRGAAVFGALAVLGPLGWAYGGATAIGGPGVFPGWWATALAAGLFVAQVCLHESTHALVAQVLRVPVRAAGVALVLGVLPYVYVDRTDAYRVRSRVARVALVLGPVLLDGVFLAVAAVLATRGGALPAAVARALLPMQVFTLLMNLNPLLPSDGYAAVEAATGLVDPRGRALTLVYCAVRRWPLPPYLASLASPTSAWCCT